MIHATALGRGGAFPEVRHLHLVAGGAREAVRVREGARHEDTHRGGGAEPFLDRKRGPVVVDGHAVRLRG